jgi:hypothetical protein
MLNTLTGSLRCRILLSPVDCDVSVFSQRTTVVLVQEDGAKKNDTRELTAEEKEEQRAMAYTLEAEEATRMVRNRYGGTPIATDGPSSPCPIDMMVCLGGLID